MAKSSWSAPSSACSWCVYAGANIYGALLGAMVACAVLGVLSVFVAVRPVPKDRPLAPLISTIGLTIVLQNLAVYIIRRPAARRFPRRSGRRSITSGR